MKHILSFALTLVIALAASVIFALPARAQNSCVPYRECQPLVTRALTGPVGTHLYWFVRNDAGTIDHHGFSCLNEVCDFDKFLTISNEVLIGKKTAAAAWAENMSFVCDYSFWGPQADGTELPVCAERKAILAQHYEQWLEGIPKFVVMWRVKANGTEATRPIRALQNGVLQPQVIGRATVDAPCVVTSVFLQSGEDRWMQYWDNGNLRPVVLCERVKP